MWLTHLRRTTLAGIAALIAVGAILGLAVPARATTQDMSQLPVVEPFRCLICHLSSPEEGGGPALNAFGTDFLANLRRWTSSLAGADSDRDGCLNGIELGDSDGDGIADGNIVQLSSNPGAADCGASLDATTWGELKALFESR